MVTPHGVEGAGARVYGPGKHGRAVGSKGQVDTTPLLSSSEQIKMMQH